MAAKPFPILCFMPASVSEAVLASGLVRRLHEEIPNAEFTIVAGLRSAELFRDLPGLKESIVYGGDRFADWFALWRRLRPRTWGFVLDAADAPITPYLSARKKAVRKPGGEGLHRVAQAARMLKVDEASARPFLFTSPETEAKAAALVPRGGPVLAMAPAAGWVGRTWPVERYSFAATRLLGERGPIPDGRLLILAGVGDWRAAEPLRRSIPRERWIDLTGATDLLDAFACLKRVDLFIGGATSLMHLAAAAGAPTLGLFGPTDERIYAPWGPAGHVLRGPRSFEQVRNADPELNQPVCHMLDLQVEAVVEAATALLKEPRAHARDL